MAQPVNQFTIRGDGFQGLNTEMSPIGSDPSFSLRADNCVVDRVGRVSAREAFKSETEVNTSTFAGEDCELVHVSAFYPTHEHTTPPEVVCTVLTGVYKDLPTTRMDWNQPEDLLGGGIDTSKPYEYTLGYDNGGDIVQCTFPGGTNKPGLAYSKYVHFKDDLFLFSRDNDFLRYDGAGTWSAVSYTGPEDNGGPLASGINGDVAISAYGRLWVSGVDGDYQKIYYSSLLREDQWYDGKDTPDDDQNTAGIIDVSEYWPVDHDHIVNIHAHNGLLIVFGRRSILIYANANTGDPASEGGIFLQDGISNVGLVDRDAVCNIGTDVMFCDDTGIRSLGRVIQEKSNPMGEPSMNIKRELQDMIAKELLSNELVQGVELSYWPSKSLVVCLFRSTSTAYTFSTERPSTTGGAKATRWTNCHFASMYFAEDDAIGRPLLGGIHNTGLLRYQGYISSIPYWMNFESMALGVTGSTVQTLIAKSIIYLVLSQAVPARAKAKWGFGSYLQHEQEFKIETKGTTEFAVALFGKDEFLGGEPGIWKNKVNTIGAGEFMRVGLEIEVDGSPFAIQEIAVNTAVGRIAA